MEPRSRFYATAGLNRSRNCDAAQASDGSFCDAGLVRVVTDAAGTVGSDFALKTAA
jgi:hypothetical protein